MKKTQFYSHWKQTQCRLSTKMGKEIRGTNYQNCINQYRYKANVFVGNIKVDPGNPWFRETELNTTGVENFTAGRRGGQSKILLFWGEGGTNLRRQIARVTKFRNVAPNILGLSVSHVLHVTPAAPRNFRLLLDFKKHLCTVGFIIKFYEITSSFKQMAVFVQGYSSVQTINTTQKHIWANRNVQGFTLYMYKLQLFAFVHKIIIIIIIIIIINLSWSWATCWPVPVSCIQKSL